MSKILDTLANKKKICHTVSSTIRKEITLQPHETICAIYEENESIWKALFLELIEVNFEVGDVPHAAQLVFVTRTLL